MRKMREVLRLRHALSLSYREIGEALGISKTAAVHCIAALRRGKSLLRHRSDRRNSINLSRSC
jgi:DNA-directed RNA polymerase specialized sigma24 family protein